MKLINSDCIAAMKEMPDNSVDSVVTDPPYELGFMGKSWDSSGIAFNVEVWQEALRVLKPGGHLIAFSGSRTYHRMAVAIEDAGFEIRDQIQWIYGSGFPKSHNISKAIDKAAGAERKIGNQGSTHCSDFPNPCSGHNETGRYSATVHALPTLPNTNEAQQWDGWGTALKPAHEPMVLARKPLVGTVADNVLIYGTGGLNIDATRVVADGENFDNLKSRPIGKLNTRRNDETDEEFDARVGQSPEQQEALAKLKELGRFPANVIHDGSWEVLELFPDSKGGAYPAKRGQSVNTAFASGQETEGGFRAMGDSGSAARFFYCAKASKRDRNEGLEGFTPIRKVFMATKNGTGEPSKGLERFTTEPSANHHPTVKPTDLMRYLCKLITPPNGIVLDPFMGSGSTGKAAVIEGFDFIGIEQSEEYIKIAEARIEYARKQSEQQLF